MITLLLVLRIKKNHTYQKSNTLLNTILKIIYEVYTPNYIYRNNNIVD